MDQGLRRAALARRGVGVAGHVVRAGADLPGAGVVPGADLEWVRANGGGVVDLLECGGARRRCRGRQDLRAEPR
jgi:hypothetical protein